MMEAEVAFDGGAVQRQPDNGGDSDQPDTADESDTSSSQPRSDFKEVVTFKVIQM